MSCFTIDPALISSETLMALTRRCIANYSEAVQGFDRLYAQAAAKTPAVHLHVQELTRRAHEIMKAYVKVNLRTKDPKGVHPLTMAEDFALTLGCIRFFLSDSSASGSVGYNVFHIKAVLERGSLRQRMTLLYSFEYFLVREKVFLKAALMAQINEELAKLPGKAAFQVDIELALMADPAIGDFVPTSLSRSRFQRASDERFMRYAKPPSREPPPERLKVDEVEDLSLAELRTITGEPHPKTAHVVTWRPGSELYALHPEYNFVKRAIALGSLPVSSGPSGSASALINLSRWMGVNKDLPLMMAALAAWMIPTLDHTLHEIRAMGQELDPHLGYTGGPENFGPDDPSIAPEVKATLEALLGAAGKKYPSYYLSFEGQREASSSL